MAAQAYTRFDVIDAFNRTLADAGQPVDQIEVDGQIHRYHPDKPKASERPCWYVANWLSNGHLTAAFGDWRSDADHRFRSWDQGLNGADRLDPAEVARAEQEQADRRHKAEQARTDKQARAAAAASELWKKLPETGQSAYLDRKQVPALGVRFGQDDGGPFVAVPMRGPAGDLRGLQRIYDSGQKRFSSGAAKKGSFHLIGEIDPDRVLYVAEGYATAATVHLATNCPVVVAFDSGNLYPIVQALRVLHPRQALTIAADDDTWKPEKGNPGREKGQAAARRFGAKVVLPDFTGLDTSDKPTDFNDLHRLAGLDEVRRQLEATAESVSVNPPERPEGAATLLVKLAEVATFWHDADGTGYATLPAGDHREHWKIRSKAFRDWLIRRFYRHHAKVPGSQALQDAINLLDGRARFDGEMVKPWLRVAESDGKLYLDLCDAQWRAVEIDAMGWRVVDNPPVTFIRTRGMLPLPEPRRDGTLSALWDLMNIPEGDDRLLVAGWLVQTLRPTGPYPVLCFQGEQGSAKSTQSKLLRALVDPHSVLLRTAPRDEKDLIIGAIGNHIMALDNLSGLPVWLSDALCRLATGGGLATRQLYTDDEEVLFNVCRPTILNGIDDIANRQDLIDRCILINLPPLPEKQRRTEKALLDAFERERPTILGALLNAASDGLRRVSSVGFDRLPRMADFALWASACELALGAEDPGHFMTAYAEAREQAVESGLEGSPIYTTLKALGASRNCDPWKGTVSTLLTVLASYLDEGAANTPRSWPSSPRALRSQLNRLAPALRSQGITPTFSRSNRERTVSLEWVCKSSSPPSLPSPDMQEPSNNRCLGGDGGDGRVTVGDGRVTVGDGRVTITNERTVTVKSQHRQDVRSSGDGSDGGDGEMQPYSYEGQREVFDV